MMNKQINTILADKKLDAILITTTSNIIYLSGYIGFSPIEREGYILVTKKSHHILTDGRYTNAIKNLSQHFEIHEISTQNTLTKILDNIISKNGVKILGFEADNLTVAEYMKIKKIGAKLKAISLTDLRIIKSEDEIQKIKKSCDIANDAVAKIRKKIQPGITEKNIAYLLEDEVKKSGAELSFPTIVAFGKNAATPHHMTSDQKLKKEDLILIDFGVKYNNFCSDMTRTFFIGSPSKKLEEMYNVVEKSQKLAIDYVRSCLEKKNAIHTSTVDKVARDYILSQNYPSIPHSLGHGIGIEVHEAPRLSQASKDILTEGMVFSIEPGIYLPHLGGIRIEDLFTIQNNQLLKLT
jgi:Xaa-Pro aminopeptidase